MSQKISKQLTILIIILAALIICLGYVGYIKNDVAKNNQEGDKRNIDTQINKEENENKRLIGNGCYDYPTSPHFRKDFNLEPASKTVKYYSKEYGISFEIPYNSNWGNKDCTVNPYFEYKTDKIVMLFFGKPRAWGSDEFSLEFNPKKNLEETVKEASKMADSVPTHKLINNINAVEYVSYGVTAYIKMKIIGEKYNYLFTTEEENKEKLEQIINTIKLVN